MHIFLIYYYFLKYTETLTGKGNKRPHADFDEDSTPLGIVCLLYFIKAFLFLSLLLYFCLFTYIGGYPLGKKDMSFIKLSQCKFELDLVSLLIC